MFSTELISHGNKTATVVYDSPDWSEQLGPLPHKLAVALYIAASQYPVDQHNTLASLLRFLEGNTRAH